MLHMTVDPHNVTLAILAGGEGSRMGGPKGMLRVHGRPILHHLLDRLGWPGPTLLVTAPGREHPLGWERFDAEAVDPVRGQGPLRGILTALEGVRTDLLAVITVDMPGVISEQLIALINHLGDHPAIDAAHYRCGDSPEPFPSVLRSSAAVAVRRMLDTGRRSVHRLADEAHVAMLAPLPRWPASLWINLNEPADLAAYMESEHGALA